MTEHKWESVEKDSFHTTQRMKVSGGWLYHRRDWFNSMESNNFVESTTMCFVPDVNLAEFGKHIKEAYEAGYERGKMLGDGALKKAYVDMVKEHDERLLENEARIRKILDEKA